MDEGYRIWSVEHQAWWGPNNKGYVSAWGSAGLYSDSESKEICIAANYKVLEEFRVPQNIKASLAFMKKVTAVLDSEHALGPNEIKMAMVIAKANEDTLPNRRRHEPKE